MKLNIADEYSKLDSVVVSSALYYDEKTIAVNNETIRYYVENGGILKKKIF